MKIVAGCYERFVWGWEPDFSTGELIPSFSRPAHLGPIKCAAAWGADVVTGASDDTIHVFDVRSNMDVGSLQGHKAAVTTLEFYASDGSVKATHLFSGCEDGTISIWDADSWIHLKSMKGKAPIYDLSVHPSGRLGLSVERGGGFRMWNLINGRCTFKSKLLSEASLLNFIPGGDSYALVSENVVEMHNGEDGKLFQSLQHEKRVLCVAPFKDKLLFTGGEDCSISAWDFRAGKLAYAINSAHLMRVKGVTVMESATESCFIASVSSDGFMKVWDTRVVQNGSKPTPLMEAETKARLTCIVSCSRTGKGTSKGSALGNAEPIPETDRDDQLGNAEPVSETSPGKESAEEFDAADNSKSLLDATEQQPLENLEKKSIRNRLKEQKKGTELERLKLLVSKKKKKKKGELGVHGKKIKKKGRHAVKNSKVK